MKRRLIIDLEFDLDSASPHEIDEILSTIPDHLSGNGMFTGDSPATVVAWSHQLMTPSDTPDLHAPENEPLVLAAVKAYESMRNRASIEAMKSMRTITVYYDRISNAEEETPFGFCPPSGLPLLCRWGQPISEIIP